MNDRHLLECAALAAGAKEVTDFAGSMWVRWKDGQDFELWNSLEFDGDAFRLAIAIGLELSLWGGTLTAKKGSASYVELPAGENSKQSARRLVTLAAAQVQSWTTKESASQPTAASIECGRGRG